MLRTSIAAMMLAAAPLAFTASTPVAAAAPYQDGGVADFYRSRGGAPLWLSPAAGPAASQLIQLLATARADNLNPGRYPVRALTRALQAARSGDPGAVQRAEAMLSQAFVSYADDLKRDPRVGVIYVDSELRPTPPSARVLLDQASRTPSLS